MSLTRNMISQEMLSYCMYRHLFTSGEQLRPYYYNMYCTVQGVSKKNDTLLK